MTKASKILQWIPIVGIFVILSQDENDEDAMFNSHNLHLFFLSAVEQGLTFAGLLVWLVS